MKNKEFTSLKEAKEFAAKVHGFIEGAFIDIKLNATWLVFYK